MPTYKYIARDQDGKTVTGKISADAEAMVIVELRKRNLVIVVIDEEKASALAPAGRRSQNGNVLRGRPDLFGREQFHLVSASDGVLERGLFGAGRADVPLRVEGEERHARRVNAAPARGGVRSLAG